MEDQLQTAFQLHQTGRFSVAAQAYHQILVRDPDHTDALHLLGVLHHQQGDHSRAVELIGRAIALRPNISSFHANLAEAYRALGQFERAAGCCRIALHLWPDYPEALCNLGLALHDLNRHAEAAENYRRALEIRPDFVAARNNLGVTLRELKQFDEALIEFRRAVEIDPGFSLAQTNLGQLLLDRGAAEEALPHCQEAVRLQPDLAVLHHNLANVYRALKRPVDARAAYLEALRLDAGLAAARAQVGLTLQEEGQLGDARAWLKQAVELEPANPTYWEHLAELCGEQEDHEQAIPCWERVLALGAERAGVHNALGWALQEEGRLAEAGEHYRAALQLEPDLAGTHLNLGGLHEELGELSEAEASFRCALRLQRGYALPHARLAVLLRGKLPDADRAALEERLKDPDLGDEPRSHLLFGLAQTLDARGAYVRAADCLRDANARAYEASCRRKREYTPAEHERFVSGLREAFGTEFFARAAGTGSSSRRPTFVFGLPRSGTTLIEQVLASHPQVHGAGELRLARQSFDAIPSVVNRSDGPLLCVPYLDGPALGKLTEHHLKKLALLDGGGAQRIVDKMPDNYLYAGLLAAMFPNATLIHCRRDLRDIAVSCWMTDFRSIRWANTWEHIATRFQQYHRIMDHWRTVLPRTIHEVRYEDTVADLETVARRVISASGLDWHPACLEFHRTKRPVRTASVTQVRQPVYKQSVARWKNYEHELADLFAQLPSSSTADQ